MYNFLGREHEDKPELFEIKNGMMVSRVIEKTISGGLMPQAPGLREDASHKEIDEWKASCPRSYEVHAFNPDSNRMKHRLDPYRIIDANNKTVSAEVGTWAELHGRPVQFRSDHRPRARYLY